MTPYLALLVYRSTPLFWCKFSPVELLMGRHICTTLPMLMEHLEPNWSFLKEFRELDDQYKHQQKADFDRWHRTHILPPLADLTPVFVHSPGSQKSTGTVLSNANTPWSYFIDTPSGSLRQNRLHLTPIPTPKSTLTPAPQNPPILLATSKTQSPTHSFEVKFTLVPQRSPIKTRTRTGAVMKLPQRLTYTHTWERGMWQPTGVQSTDLYVLCVLENNVCHCCIVHVANLL